MVFGFGQRVPLSVGSVVSAKRWTGAGGIESLDVAPVSISGTAELSPAGWMERAGEAVLPGRTGNQGEVSRS